jgi:hypothetical protein
LFGYLGFGEFGMDFGKWAFFGFEDEVIFVNERNAMTE